MRVKPGFISTGLKFANILMDETKQGSFHLMEGEEVSIDYETLGKLSM